MAGLVSTSKDAAPSWIPSKFCGIAAVNFVRQRAARAMVLTRRQAAAMAVPNQGNEDAISTQSSVDGGSREGNSTMAGNSDHIKDNGHVGTRAAEEKIKRKKISLTLSQGQSLALF